MISIPALNEPPPDPKTYEEAMKQKDAYFWLRAMEDEINSILSNNTWVLTELPPGANLIGTKWVFKKIRKKPMHTYIQSQISCSRLLSSKRDRL